MSRRVGIVCDLAGEGWPSMEIVADQLIDHLRALPDAASPFPLRAPTVRRLSRLPMAGRVARLRTLDRLANRYFDCPRWLEAHRGDCDLYHVIDHSYAHVASALGAKPIVVTCHDLDAFRPLLTPRDEPRPAWFRALVRRTAEGLRTAARIACVSASIRDELAASGLVDPERLRVIPNGVDAEMRPDPSPAADAAAARLLGPPGSADLLHVGSAIPRKRLDIVLRAFADVRTTHPDARLIRVGGLGAHRALARSLGVDRAVVELPFLERPVLAAVYRRAAVVLMASDREGFGLPVAEALACGAPVVASDIPSLRETGGDAAVYAAPGDPDSFAGCIREALSDRSDGRRDCGLRQAARFTWGAHARAVAALYREVA